MVFQNVPRVRRCAFWTVVFSFLAYGYRFFSAGFGGDAALVSLSGQAAYQASLGRFLQPVYWLIRGSLVVPSVVGLFTTVFLFLSCWLIANLFGLNRTRDIALLSGLLVTHETLVVSGATYLPWMDVYALSLLFAVLGAYLLMSGGRRAWLSSVFFFLSLGLYQSYLPCAAALMILALARQTLDGKRPGHVFARGCLACLSILAGLLLYALVLAGVLSLTGNNASFAYNGVGSLGSFDFSSIPRYLADTVLTPIRFLFIPDSGAIPSHASSISPYLNWALLLPGLILLFIRAKRLRPGGRAMLLLLVCLLVPGCNFVQFIWQGVISVLLLASSALKTDAFPARAAARGAQLLLCLVILQNVPLSNQLCVKRDLELSSTLSAFTRILDQAEQTKGYVPGETPVVVVGMLPSSSVSMERPGFESLADHQGVRYTYAAAYEGANAWYLRMILGSRVQLVENRVMRALSDSPEAQAMPCFPSEGFCQMIDGMLYIRLS